MSRCLLPLTAFGKARAGALYVRASLCVGMWHFPKLRDNGFLPSSERSKVHCKAGGTAQHWEVLPNVSRMFKFHAISLRFSL